MKIETKYNIGDEVWVIIENKVQKMLIADIRVSTATIQKTNLIGEFQIVKFVVSYYLGNGEWVAESDLFPTKEELLKSL